ncbi:MAG: hypothetical protein DMF31_03895 [Verrucomicrobia bacterium]|nr:MAG: hypothetical protein DMF31_03895 [Verrucomicrobiota bacterium]
MSDWTNTRAIDKIRNMRLAIFLATLVAMSASAVAGAIKITSPDHPRRTLTVQRRGANFTWSPATVG